MQALTYNSCWGTLDRYTLDGNGKRISNGQGVVSTRLDCCHKPWINFDNLWRVTDQLFISTVAYASHGTGGGLPSLSSVAGQSAVRAVHDYNRFNPLNPVCEVDLSPSSTGPYAHRGPLGRAAGGAMVRW